MGRGPGDSVVWGWVGDQVTVWWGMGRGPGDSVVGMGRGPRDSVVGMGRRLMHVASGPFWFHLPGVYVGIYIYV